MYRDLVCLSFNSWTLLCKLCSLVTYNSLSSTDEASLGKYWKVAVVWNPM